MQNRKMTPLHLDFQDNWAIADDFSSLDIDDNTSLILRLICLAIDVDAAIYITSGHIIAISSPRQNYCRRRPTIIAMPITYTYKCP